MNQGLEMINPFDRLGFSNYMDKIGTMIKKADYRLPEDPAQWNAAIQDAMETQLPEAIGVGSNPHIVYKHKDWGSKCALGSISIAIGGSLLVFPIVIRYGNLAPFDTVYVHNEDRWMHTSPENMRQFESAESNSVFGGVTTKEITGDNEYSDRWSYLQSPRGYSFKGGRKMITGGVKESTCPIVPLDEAMKYAQEHTDRILFSSPQTRKLFKLAAESSAEAAKAFYDAKNLGKEEEDAFADAKLEQPEKVEKTIPDGEITPLSIKQANKDLTLPIFDRVPDEERQAIEKRQEEIEEPLNSRAFRKVALQFCDLLYLKKAGINDYIIKMGRRGCKGVFEVRGGVDKVAEYLADGDIKGAAKILDAVDDAQDILIDSAAADSNIGHIETLGNTAIVDNANRITRFGIYDVFTEAGDREAGHVIPLVDWDGEKSTMFLFISDRSWALQSNINGTASTFQTILPNGVIRPERRGAFVYDKDGSGMAFPPIEIKSVLSTGAGMVIRGTDLGSMKNVNMVMSKDVPGPMEFTQANDPQNWMPGHTNVYMPMGVKFVPLPSNITKIASVDDTKRRLNLKMASLSRNVAKLAKVSGAYRVSTDYPLYSYPEGIMTIMKSADFRSYDGTRDMTQKEAEFALRMGGAILSDKMVQLVKEGRNGKIDVPVETAAKMADANSSLVAGAELTHFMALPARYKAASADLRLDMKEMLDVVTIAPSLGKYASKVLVDILETAPGWIGKNASRLKGADYDEKPTLDDLFELGFLDDKSLRYYIDKSQDIEELEDFLCKVLITTRVAGFGLEEDSAQNALYGVSELKNALSAISLRVNRTN